MEVRVLKGELIITFVRGKNDRNADKRMYSNLQFFGSDFLGGTKTAKVSLP